MTREEAQAECDRLGAESPDRNTHRFVPVKDDAGQWQVGKINIPPAEQPTGTATRADEKPPTADDPRDAFSQNVNPWAV